MIYTIVEGTSEIQRLVIARHLGHPHPVVRAAKQAAPHNDDLERGALEDPSITSNGIDVSTSEHRACSTATPRTPASERASSISVVLPVPASPTSIRTVPAPRPVECRGDRPLSIVSLEDV